MSLSFTNILQVLSGQVLGEWILALLVVLLTGIVASATRALLKRLHPDRGWKVLRLLAPSASNILYIVGLKIFQEVAPLKAPAREWVEGGVYVFGIIIYLGLIQRAALLAIEWSAFKTNQSKVLQQGFIPLMRNVITLFVFFSGGIMILEHFNYDVMSLVTALGVGSLAVGLAAKDTLSNMISGFILIIDKNLRPGDRINLAGIVGDVKEIGLRSTLFKMGDGNSLIVPNAELVNTRILNMSIPSPATQATVLIRVPYSIGFARIKEICLLILSQITRVSRDQSGWVNLTSLSEGHQLIQVGFWVASPNDMGGTISEFNERLLNRFQQEGIPLAAPIQSNSTLK